MCRHVLRVEDPADNNSAEIHGGMPRSQLLRVLSSGILYLYLRTSPCQAPFLLSPLLGLCNGNRSIERSP